MIYGLDLLGLAKYPNINLPQGFALGAFANTFGDSLPAVERLVLKGCKHVRIHLLWSDSHTFGSADLRKMVSEARRVERLAKRYPGVTWEVSPFCEHNIAAPDPYLKRCAEVAPSCTIVNTPFRGGLSRKYKNEVHGLHSAPGNSFNYSFDGTSSVDSDVPKIAEVMAPADVFFLWVPQFKGRKTKSDATPRPDRKAWPSQEMVDSVAFLATARGSVRILQNSLWKSHAEQSNTPPAPKELKPVLITPHSDTHAVIIAAKNRKEIARMARFPDPFIDGRQRYYAMQWGYRLAEKAIAVSGSPMCEIWVGETRIGRLNPAFRGPTFRE
jgi:hypothetical protein